MKEIKLNRNFFTIVDDEDYEKVSKYKWTVAQRSGLYYAVRGDKNNKIFYLHRSLLDVPVGMEVDHINGNGLDNRRGNLRICTHRENLINRKVLANNKSSKYRGVCFIKKRNKWLASSMNDGKHIHIGYFDNEIDAAKAYNEKAKELHGEFANLNVL